jgi:hypothetical protein
VSELYVSVWVIEWVSEAGCENKSRKKKRAFCWGQQLRLDALSLKR